MKKASHLSSCVKGTLRNIKTVVGNFVTCTDGHKGGFIIRRFNSSMDTRLDLKVPENYLSFQQIVIRITPMTHNSVSDLRTYLLSNYVKKLPATFFMFLRFPLTHLDRWLAFFTKIPRNFISWHMLPDYYLYECYRLLQRCSALEKGLEMSVFARSFSGEMQSLNRGLCLVNHSPSPIGAWKVSVYSQLLSKVLSGSGSVEKMYLKSRLFWLQ